MSQSGGTSSETVKLPPPLLATASGGSGAGAARSSPVEARRRSRTFVASLLDTVPMKGERGAAPAGSASDSEGSSPMLGRNSRRQKRYSESDGEAVVPTRLNTMTTTTEADFGRKTSPTTSVNFESGSSNRTSDARQSTPNADGDRLRTLKVSPDAAKLARSSSSSSSSSTTSSANRHHSKGSSAIAAAIKTDSESYKSSSVLTIFRPSVRTFPRDVSSPTSSTEPVHVSADQSDQKATASSSLPKFAGFRSSKDAIGGPHPTTTPNADGKFNISNEFAKYCSSGGGGGRNEDYIFGTTVTTAAAAAAGRCGCALGQVAEARESIDPDSCTIGNHSTIIGFDRRATADFGVAAPPLSSTTSGLSGGGGGNRKVANVIVVSGVGGGHGGGNRSSTLPSNGKSATTTTALKEKAKDTTVRSLRSLFWRSTSMCEGTSRAGETSGGAVSWSDASTTSAPSSRRSHPLSQPPPRMNAMDRSVSMMERGRQPTASTTTSAPMAMKAGMAAAVTSGTTTGGGSGGGGHLHSAGRRMSTLRTAKERSQSCTFLGGRVDTAKTSKNDDDGHPTTTDRSAGGTGCDGGGGSRRSAPPSVSSTLERLDSGSRSSSMPDIAGDGVGGVGEVGGGGRARRVLVKAATVDESDDARKAAKNVVSSDGARPEAAADQYSRRRRSTLAEIYSHVVSIVRGWYCSNLFPFTYSYRRNATRCVVAYRHSRLVRQCVCVCIYVCESARACACVRACV